MDLMEKIVSLCKRRGFVYPNSEIYGGLQGFYDYGPLGIEMKNNLKALWWRWMTVEHEDIVGIDGDIITHPRVWEASGHVQNFNEPLVECKKCHKRFSLEKLTEKKCPECAGDLTEAKKFNLLFETSLGVVEGEKKTAYLRGEACQTIYLDYQNVLDSMRLKIPFGIVQIGKAFRNEVTPKQFLFRLREFEQWDLQWFINPQEMDHWYDYWKEERIGWYQKLFTQKDKISFYQQNQKELPHYAKKAFDIVYKLNGDLKELEGIHWRSDWDLSNHGKFSGHDFSYTDSETGKKFIPWIVETSGGVDRTFLFLLLDAYREEMSNNNVRVVLALNPKISPYKIGVFPLLANKPELIKTAQKIYQNLRQEFSVAWDDRGNIGKRYFSQDEIGTPWCVTIDFQTLKDKTVTVRDRDTTKQVRLALDKLPKYFQDKLK